jgi:hypothetical protein
MEVAMAMTLISRTCQSAEELADKVAGLFAARGYKLEEGTKYQGVYGNGSAAMRVMFGGFAKRNKFSVSIMQTPNNELAIMFDKAMSGAMGGVIGVSKVEKEFKLIREMFSVL